MRVVSFSEARKHLKDVLDQVIEEEGYTVISRRNNKDTVVMSLTHFNSLIETIYLLKSPANAAHLNRSIQQYHAGKTTQSKLTKD